jgi:nicotinic acid phosphoribosyltransferase
MLHFPIQVATEALKGRKEFPCTCRDEMGIVAETLEVTLSSLAGLQLTDESVQYRADVAKRLASLINALEDKDPKRIFEVGMRACTCMAMHRIALEECKKAGITATSNVFLANELDMVAVGTTGHEHIQRWGDDLTACRAMRDMRPQRPSCLPDTFDAMGLGLPAALLSFLEQPNREGTVRFDSGDQKPQLYAVEGVSQKLLLNKPNYIFEDGIDEQKIIRDEDWCREPGIAPERRAFGSGQFIVRAEFTYMTRDRVAAVYKLCKTGDLPVMKTCATAPTKASVPGVPVTFRRVRVGACDQAYNSFAGLIGQEGETPPVGFVSLDSRLGKPDFPVDPMEVGFSPETEKLIGDCLKRIADSQSL